jgi:arabinofuranosyltransferase
MMNLSHFQPDLKAVIAAVSLLTLLSFALNIGLAWQQLGVYTLTLDDAWIHQTYARNLAQGRWFIYTGDQASSGSTSPAWTLLLAVGYWLGVEPVTWSLLCGAFFHVLAAVMVYRLSLAYFGHRWLAAWSAVLTALEWHLVWIALSGMETSMFVALTLLYLVLIQTQWEKAWLMGLAGGLLFLTRPEGLLLVALAGAKFLWARRRQSLKHLALMGLTFLVVIGPLLIFNIVVSGRPLPGTFYAKFVQWVAPWTIGKGLNYFWLLLQYFWLEGSLFIFFPLALIGGWLAWRRRLTALLPAGAWLLGLPAAYTIILPLIYNRGRYIMPLIPLIIILGAWTALEFVQRSRFKRLGRLVIALASLLVAVFWYNGARAYVLEVRAIESQHMMVAEWLRTNTPPDAVIATQDIGVLAYFSDRRLIDMAGLTDPAVVPIMHQPAQMAEYIRQHGGNYVVVFPSYYTQLIKDQGLKMVYTSDKYDFHKLGSDPLAVFQFR